MTNSIHHCSLSSSPCTPSPLFAVALSSCLAWIAGEGMKHTHISAKGICYSTHTLSTILLLQSVGNTDIWANWFQFINKRTKKHRDKQWSYLVGCERLTTFIWKTLHCSHWPRAMLSDTFEKRIRTVRSMSCACKHFRTHLYILSVDCLLEHCQ